MTVKHVHFRIDDFFGAQIGRGFALMRELARIGVPVVGAMWPWAVSIGSLSVRQDLAAGTITHTWDSDADPRDAEFALTVSFDVYTLAWNDLIKGIHIVGCLRRAGMPVVGDVWPYSVEQGVLVRHGFDAVLGNLKFSWRMP